MRRATRALLLTPALALGALTLPQYRFPAPPVPPGPPLTGTIDRILIEKSARRLVVFRDGAALRSYRVPLGTEVGTRP